jgi:deoxyadenosine/deoxycytidine kinase/NTP pyrophosphatase (non-canonical NTP hydrolase)
MSKFIAIEGVIGVGKTTLARMLQSHFDASLLLEVFEENPFLARFYEDRERYGFQTQLFFLLSRYHQQHQAVPTALGQGNLISDYTFAKDEIFAWLNLRDDELAMYGRVHAALGEKLRRPDLIVYLRADHELLMRRITLRDRPYERDMDPGYIRDVAAAYDAWLANAQDSPVLIIEVNELDFLARPSDLNYILEKIKTALAQHTPVAAAAPPLLQPTVPSVTGFLAAYQQFHRQLDASKGFSNDPYFNYLLLAEETGELATAMAKTWNMAEKLRLTGKDRAEAQTEAIAQHRAAIRNELADVLAYIIKLANYTDIDLEEAYLEKMRHNIQRTWEL